MGINDHLYITTECRGNLHGGCTNSDVIAEWMQFPYPPLYFHRMPCCVIKLNSGWSPRRGQSEIVAVPSFCRWHAQTTLYSEVLITLNQSFMKPNVALFLFVVLWVFIIIYVFSAKTRNKVRIIKQCTDQRGFTSVIYIQNGDTVALDYLSGKQMDSLISQ